MILYRRLIVQILLIICIDRVYANSSMLIFAFGPEKTGKLDDLKDEPCQTLLLLEFSNEMAHKLIGRQNYSEIKLITDKCSAYFDWIDHAYDALGFDEIKQERINPNINFDYILHVGPLCEYKDAEVARYEMTDYIINIQTMYATMMNSTKKVVNFFTSSSLTVGVKEKDERLKKSEQATMRSLELSKIGDNYSSFVPLMITIRHYAEMIFKFASVHLSNYTAILIDVKRRDGHVGIFCRHLTSLLKETSGEHGRHFNSFYYVDVDSESGYLNIWNHVLQRSRYVLFCGNVTMFQGWLKASLKLKELGYDYEISIQQFGIFYVAYGLDTTNDYIKPMFAAGTTKFFSGIPEAIHNVKLLILSAPTECNKSSLTNEFCRQLDQSFGSLVKVPEESDELMRYRFYREVYFYALSLFNLFVTIYADFDKFWNYSLHMADVRPLLNQTNEIHIFDFFFQQERVAIREVCVFTDLGLVGNGCNFDWGGKARPQQKPGDCGYRECDIYSPPNWTLVIVVVATIVGVGLLTSILSVYGYLKYRKKKEWAVTPLGNVRIKIEDIKPVKANRVEAILKLESAYRPKGVETDAVGGDGSKIRLDLNYLDPVSGTFCSTCVTVYPFKVAKSKEQAVRDFAMKMRELSIENVAKVHGYVVQNVPLLYGLVMESGEHGALFSLLKLDDLDLALKLPLLADLCRALEHIHKSSLKHHGNLTSVCCVVDSHFVLKVQLTEFPTLKRLATPDSFGNSVDDDSEKIWSAPEVLRKESNVALALADIYSFGIIAHEIIYQKGPFYVTNQDFSLVHKPTDESFPQTPMDKVTLIVRILKDKKRRQIRPSMKVGHAEEAVMLILKEMMKNCWEESPLQRWNLNKISQAIKKTMHDMRIVNAFGSMVERLEFYTKHLQEALQQKADKVEEERRRIRDVLDRLFPGGIAKKLIDGERPQPTHYKNICIYYNDLVSFTVIASKNTPATVVKFLNTLFLKYDNIIEMYTIHPVTRIGDAYMLVSGIPIEFGAAFHASEIAQAALQIVATVKETRFDDVKEYNQMVIRTGIASGRAVAGVVGKEIPSFCICGESVVVAATMESKSEAMKILVAQSSYELLKADFDLTFAKTVDINNVKVNAYWLNGMKGVKTVTKNQRLDGKTGPYKKDASAVSKNK